MIELLVHTVTRKTDVNGNRYYFCRFTFTATGETIMVDGMGGTDGNGLPGRLFDAVGDTDSHWEKMYATNETRPIQDWNRMVEISGNEKLYEHQALPILKAALLRARKAVIVYRAAPDLLTACETAAASLSICLLPRPDDTSASNEQIMQATLEALKYAIAKAKG